VGGVWCSATPNLIFIPDRNGDDVPDGPPEVLLNGWNDGKIGHCVVNGLQWGPDGWLYGNQGFRAVAGRQTRRPRRRADQVQRRHLALSPRQEDL